MTEKKENQTQNELKDSVMKKIEGQKPTAKEWYQAVNWTRFVIILLLAIVAGILLGFYLWELVENLKQASNFDLGVIAIINSFVELLLVTGLISLLLYFLYRQTDWFLVSQRLSVFLGIWGIILTISIIFLAFSMTSPEVSQFLEDTKTQSNKLPFRQQRVDNILERQKENGFVVGRIENLVNINKDEVEIKIQNPNEQITLKASSKLVKNLKVGDFVRVKIDTNNSSKALEINKIRRPMPNFIEQPVIF